VDQRLNTMRTSVYARVVAMARGSRQQGVNTQLKRTESVSNKKLILSATTAGVRSHPAAPTAGGWTECHVARS
jgi:hypothetical protein